MKKNIQSKVSLIIPIYNKIDSIDLMLESVYNQCWNNIEVILVNDGATDGTREHICEWESKYKSRGYEIIIIDQENQGIPGAVKSGLLRMTGNYVCVIDCDDILDNEYVSTMAYWLDNNPEDMWVACLWSQFSLIDGERKILYTIDESSIPSPPNMMEKYLSSLYTTMIWIYMVRVDYFYKCKVIEGYRTDIRATQEPGFILPLILEGGKLKIINRSLYYYNKHEGQTTAYKSAESVINYLNEYKDLTIKIIEGLDAGNHNKNKWNVIAELANKRFILSSIKRHDDKSKYNEQVASETASLINKHFIPNPKITVEHILENDYLFLSLSVSACILGTDCTNYINEIISLCSGRVIVWGALGERGKQYIPMLINTKLEPTEQWDAEGDGINILKPNPTCLESNDLVLVFPFNDADIMSTLEKTNCKILRFNKIIEYISSLKYPMYYDGSISFI